MEYFQARRSRASPRTAAAINSLPKAHQGTPTNQRPLLGFRTNQRPLLLIGFRVRAGLFIVQVATAQLRSSRKLVEAIGKKKTNVRGLGSSHRSFPWTLPRKLSAFLEAASCKIHGTRIHFYGSRVASIEYSMYS